MTALLHRLGFVYKQPKRIPGKADPVAQEAFRSSATKARATSSISWMRSIRNTIRCSAAVGSNAGRSRRFAPTPVGGGSPSTVPSTLNAWSRWCVSTRPSTRIRPSPFSPARRSQPPRRLDLRHLRQRSVLPQQGGSEVSEDFTNQAHLSSLVRAQPESHRAALEILQKEDPLQSLLWDILRIQIGL